MRLAEVREAFLYQCGDAFDDLCEQIARGDIPVDLPAEITLQISPGRIAQIHATQIGMAA